jgi:hypothetical protein
LQKLEKETNIATMSLSHLVNRRKSKAPLGTTAVIAIVIGLILTGLNLRSATVGTANIEIHFVEVVELSRKLPVADVVELSRGLPAVDAVELPRDLPVIDVVELSWERLLISLRILRQRIVVGPCLEVLTCHAWPCGLPIIGF